MADSSFVPLPDHRIIQALDGLKEAYNRLCETIALHVRNAEKYDGKLIDVRAEVYRSERKLLAALLRSHLDLRGAEAGPFAHLGAILQEMSLEARER